MQLSKTFTSALSYAAQTDAAVIPTTGWKELPRTNHNLTINTEFTNSETIRDTRVENKGRVTKATAGGDVSAEFFYSVYDEFLSGAAYNDWVGDVLTFGGNKEKMFAIETYDRVNTIAEVFLGTVVNTLKLDVGSDGLIKLDFGLMARTYKEKDEGTRYATAVTLASNLTPASPIDITDIKIDGVTTTGTACVTALSLDVNNNVQSTTCIGTGDIFNAGLAEMKQTVGGNLTLGFTKQSHALVRKQLSGETLNIEFTVNFPNQGSYRFVIPQAQLSEASKTENNNLMYMNLGIKSVESPITITRIPYVATP